MKGKGGDTMGVVMRWSNSECLNYSNHSVIETRHLKNVIFFIICDDSTFVKLLIRAVVRLVWRVNLNRTSKHDFGNRPFFQ